MPFDPHRMTGVGAAAPLGTFSAPAQNVDKKRPPPHYEFPSGSASSEAWRVSSLSPELYLDGSGAGAGAGGLDLSWGRVPILPQTWYYST